MKQNILTVILFSLLASIWGCRTANSFVFVGENKAFALRALNGYHSYLKKQGFENKFIEKSDTIASLSYNEQQPIELVLIFKENKCIFEELNVYCSPCADKMMNDIYKDKRYHFKVYDGNTSISQKDKSIIMKHKNVKTDTTICSKIIIRKMGEKK